MTIYNIFDQKAILAFKFRRKIYQYMYDKQLKDDLGTILYYKIQSVCVSVCEYVGLE